MKIGHLVHFPDPPVFAVLALYESLLLDLGSDWNQSNSMQDPLPIMTMIKSWFRCITATTTLIYCSASP